MSNYKGHATINLLFFLPVLLGIMWTFFSKNQYDLMIFGGSFAYGTLFMSPDLDMANKIKLFSVRGVLSLPFRSYAKVFSHRGVSHSIFFGTLTRVLWLFAFFLLIAYLFSSTKQFHYNLIAYKQELIFALSGLFLADAGHILVDKG